MQGVPTRRQNGNVLNYAAVKNVKNSYFDELLIIYYRQ